MASDVKVTLTADDEATEVVRRLASAVKQLDAQQRTANQGTAQSAANAKQAATAFESFKGAVLRVAEALAAIRVLEFVRETVSATDEIGKLAQKTGATTQALSILGVAAENADVSQQDLASGLRFLSRSVTELQSGVPKAVEAFAAFGLTARDLKGLSLDQILLRIAAAQAHFADGAGKAAVAMTLFGRNGSELIPLLNSLAAGGFDEATKKANELGIVISANDVVAAHNLDVAIADLKGALRGLVLQMEPVIKAMADLTKGITNLLAKRGDLIEFIAITGSVAFAIDKIVKAVVALRGVIAAGGIASLFTVPGVIIAAFAVLAGIIGVVVTKLHEARDAQKALDEAALGKDPALDRALGIDKKKPDVTVVDPAQRKALIDAQLAATKQGLADELAATQAGLKLVEELDSEAFAQGLIGLREFYAERVQITKQGVAAQVSELQAQKQALSASPLPENTEAARVTRAKDLKSLEDQIALAKLNGQTAVLALLEQERTARLRIADEVRGFNEQILTAQGNNFAAAQSQIVALQNRFALALEAQGGHTTDAIKAQVDELGRLLTLRAQFAQVEQRTNQETTSLDLARAAIQTKVAQGLISERDGQLQIAAVERQRLPTLENLADQMDKLGHDIRDPALIQAAEELRVKIQAWGTVTDESAVKIRNLRETLLSTAQSDLSEFLGSTISQVGSLGEAFRQLGTSIVQSFQKVLGDILATKAIEAIRSLIEKPAQSLPQIAAADATSKSAAELGGAGLVVGSAANDMSGAAGELAAAGALLIEAARELAAATAASAASSAASDFAGFIGPLVGLARGGPVSGPGSGTSDSILARLSAGEYVIRAAAVRRLGIPLLDMLNGLRIPQILRPQVMGLPAFAGGGFVGGSASASVSGGLDVTVRAAPGSVIDELKTRGGIKGLREILGSNPRAFRADLGLG